MIAVLETVAELVCLTVFAAAVLLLAVAAS